MTEPVDPDLFPLDELISAATAIPWRTSGAPGELGASFLKQVQSGIDPREFEGFSVADVAAMAWRFWRWTDIRQGPSAMVRVSQATGANGESLPRTLLEIVGPDMAFLVGSVLGACQEMGKSVHAVLHPILEHGRTADGRRDLDDREHRESYIQIHLEPLAEDEAALLCQDVHQTLNDVRASVSDFPAMRQLMLDASLEVANLAHLEPEIRDEAAAFLDWLARDNFTFLGSRTYDFEREDTGRLKLQPPTSEADNDLGVLRDQTRYILYRGSEPTAITKEISEFLEEQSPVIVAKSNMRSRVHRRVYADYIGVKRYDEEGRLIGETRFAGLFTSEAYNRQARDVPLIRQKVEWALRAAGKRPGSHDQKALQNILETFPRDELFQIDEAQLLKTSLGILNIQDRGRTRLFLRRDRFGRYISALVFVPREVFNSALRERIGKYIAAAYKGRVSAFYPQFGDGPLARIHYIIGLNPGHPEPARRDLEEHIVTIARTWEESFLEAVRDLDDPAKRSASARYAYAFNAAYREAFDSDEALKDVAAVLRLSETQTVSLRAYRKPGDETSTIRAKIYAQNDPVLLSDCVPVFENMGLFVVAETGFPVRREGGGEQWIHTLAMRSRDGTPIDLDAISDVFEAAFVAVWTKRTEDDGFNRLVPAIGAEWREAALFRTFARYRRQSGLDPAQGTQVRALTAHPRIARHLLDLFETRFDPDNGLGRDTRDTACETLRQKIVAALEGVSALDEDRVLRRFMALILATLRTSYYQTDADGEPHRHIALKIASREIENLPLPKPYREIFIWSPRVEGVHLRFGPVARGGLRWSDRRDDFRTEVLGLVKAQQVKNAVIVPVGSKGGFYPKHLPVGGDRDAVRAEGVAAYEVFINALLGLTDNLVDGQTVAPEKTVCWDDPDPYLVVAADKGTATFSDIANAISLGRGFWLGDAFASGGSVGYDHKKMGITARGGWVAVQRHFREMGKNIQTEPFDVIGVGDMSGDVFGNGMLLSKTIRLQAAFNHLDIFTDPDPVNAEANWAERKRIFDLPRSSWSDYDTSLISKGGGVFSRAAKSIELTDEIRAFLGTDVKSLTPSELIHAILKAEADLLWFGGIGTYVKAAGESDLAVGDKANDAVRVDAAQLNVKVIGEGANLGMTQAARIAFARNGGRINTDAVDNSAGVDSSDHEVNIKILLNEAILAGELQEEDRNALLASMTNEVAAHVLAHNYDQTGALSVAQASTKADIDAHERFMERLEAGGLLDRTVEGLPGPEQVRGLKENNEGLTRPEISVLMAYAKNTLFDRLVESDVPDDPYFAGTVSAYFPKAVRGMKTALANHRLRREIISTVLANRIVNLGGPTFVHRVRESAEVDTAAIGRAFAAATEIFALTELLDEIDRLDNVIPSEAQIALRREIIVVLRRQVFWLSRTRPVEDGIANAISLYRPGVEALGNDMNGLLSPFEASRLNERTKSYTLLGAPEDLARKVATLLALTSSTDVIDIARQRGRDVRKTGYLYHATGELLRFDELRTAAGSASSPQHWDRLAARRLVEDLLHQQDLVTLAIIDAGSAGDLPDSYGEARDVALAHISRNRPAFDGLLASIDELDRSGPWSFAKLVLVTDSIRAFLRETGMSERAA